MATLENVQGGSFVSDLAPGLNQLLHHETGAFGPGSEVAVES